MKVLVTGAAGAVGSHAAERLKKDGHDVYGIDAYTDYYDPRLKHVTADELSAAGIEIRTGDLADGNLVALVDDDTEFIFHFAAQPGIASHIPLATYLRNNLTATERLLDRAKQLSSLNGFVYISTSSVYGAQANGSEATLPAPTSYYGVSKLAGEQLALAYGRDGSLPVAALRLFSVYGERERPEKLFRKLIAAIDAGEPFPLHEGSREHKRSFTYVGDAVEACILVMKNFAAATNEIFNIGSDHVATTGEGIDLVEELMGKKATFMSMPPRPGDQLETGADIDKARRVLGYNPRTSLRDGLAREVAWHRSHAQ